MQSVIEKLMSILVHSKKKYEKIVAICRRFILNLGVHYATADGASEGILELNRI